MLLFLLWQPGLHTCTTLLTVPFTLPSMSPSLNSGTILSPSVKDPPPLFQIHMPYTASHICVFVVIPATNDLTTCSFNTLVTVFTALIVLLKRTRTTYTEQLLQCLVHSTCTCLVYREKEVIKDCFWSLFIFLLREREKAWMREGQRERGLGES